MCSSVGCWKNPEHKCKVGLCILCTNITNTYMCAVRPSVRFVHPRLVCASAAIKTVVRCSHCSLVSTIIITIMEKRTRYVLQPRRGGNMRTQTANTPSPPQSPRIAFPADILYKTLSLGKRNFNDCHKAIYVPIVCRASAICDTFLSECVRRACILYSYHTV